MTNSIEQLRIQAVQADLYAIEENPGKWMCIRKGDNCILAVKERSENIALKIGLVRAKILREINT